MFNNQIKTSSQLDPVTFIIGNQSADLDSIISSICLAYYKFIKSNEISYLPVLNTTVDIIEGKDECKYFFNYHKISTKDYSISSFSNNKGTYGDRCSSRLPCDSTQGLHCENQTCSCIEP